MSSDLERVLREAREALPVPGEPRRSACAAELSSRSADGKRRTRVLVLVGAMLVAAVALGVTAGSLNAPTGTAAREPAVIGFVPEQGWFALQSPPPAVPGQQTAAVAANVPFAADDVVHGLVEPSGLPYSTLLSLPPRGIVLVATMTPETIAAPRADPDESGLPEGGASSPASQRHSMGAVGSPGATRPAARAVPVTGEHSRLQRRRLSCTSARRARRRAQFDEAQRQLEGLVVRSQQSASASARARASPRHRSPRRHRSDVRLQYEHPWGHLRAEEPRALRRSERLGLGEASVGGREQWRLGWPADRAAERSG